MNLWNQNFAVLQNEPDPFNFEIDKAFAKIEDGLFESMVLAKTFNYPIERHFNGFYEQIFVAPKSQPMKVLTSKQNGLEWKWDEIEIIKDDSKFCYVDVFDWDTSERKNGQFIRSKLIESKELSYLIGSDFLFNYDKVEILRTNKQSNQAVDRNADI